MYKSVLKYVSRHSTARSIFGMFRNLESPELHRELMNLQFRSPVGMAPGFDVSAEFYNSAGAAGCGFSIVGPLYFSRKGGIRDAVAAVRNNPPVNILIGFDITKNPSSVSEDDIAKDYLDAYEYSYDFSDFTVLDFSDDSSAVHEMDFIKAVTDPLLESRLAFDNYNPLILKLSPSLKKEDLLPILDYCMMNGIDGVLLSSEAMVREASEFSKGRLPIIAEGRIGVVSRALEFFDAGASLVALQCSPIRFKTALPKAILKALRKK